MTPETPAAGPELALPPEDGQMSRQAQERQDRLERLAPQMPDPAALDALVRRRTQEAGYRRVQG